MLRSPSRDGCMDRDRKTCSLCASVASVTDSEQAIDINSRFKRRHEDNALVVGTKCHTALSNINEFRGRF